MVALGLEGRRKAEASCLGQGGFRAALVGEMLDFFFFFFVCVEMLWQWPWQRPHPQVKERQWTEVAHSLSHS